MRLFIKSRRPLSELLIEGALFLAAASSVLVTLGIVFTLLLESLPFFEKVSLFEVLTETQWTPLFEDAKYGILPLISGTILTTSIAILVAIPFGTLIAVHLTEYSRPHLRELLKPILELLAAVPTVIYGYFALLFVTPLLQQIVPNLSGFNVLSAGLVMGIMIIPYISTLTEDAMRAVPAHLREASYAMGASKLQTVFRVVIPSAFSGISSAYVLGVSRAIGETMVVAIAAGMQPNFTFDPRSPAATVTAYIVQVCLGDLPHGSIGYQTIYVAGLILLLLTLLFNLVGMWLKSHFRELEGAN